MAAAKLRSGVRKISLEVDGEIYAAELSKLPFQECIVLSCQLGEERVSIGDRQLGEHEAKRLMAEEIRRRVGRA